MNLLINESPLQVIPSLAMQVGLNAAILLQQLHFRSLISPNMRDGHKWVYKTYWIAYVPRASARSLDDKSLCTNILTVRDFIIS